MILTIVSKKPLLKYLIYIVPFLLDIPYFYLVFKLIHKTHILENVSLWGHIFTLSCLKEVITWSSVVSVVPCDARLMMCDSDNCDRRVRVSPCVWQTRSELTNSPLGPSPLTAWRRHSLTQALGNGSSPASNFHRSILSG